MKYFFLLLFLCVSGVKVAPGNISLSFFDAFSLLFVFYFLVKSKWVVGSDKALFKTVLLICLLQFVAAMLYQVSALKLVFAFRFSEYFIYLLVGAFYFANERSINKTLIWFYLLIVVFALFPVLSFYKYGLFNYAWEMPAVLGLLTMHFLFSRYSRFVKVSVLLISTILILFSGQRTPFVALALTVCAYSFINSSYKSKFIFPIVGLVVLSAASLVGDTRLFSTIKDVFDSANYDAVALFASEFSNSGLNYQDSVYGSRSLVDGSGDLSLQLRLRKWVFAAVAQLGSPHTFFIGLGPGFFGGAADSSVLRIFFETGLLGLILWFRFFKQVLSHKYNYIFYLTLCFLLNAIFIDTLYSSRVFPLYLILVGSYLGSRKLIYNAR